MGSSRGILGLAGGHDWVASALDFALEFLQELLQGSGSAHAVALIVDNKVNGGSKRSICTSDLRVSKA